MSAAESGAGAGGDAVSAGAMQALADTVSRLEGDVAAANARADAATNSAKSQLAIFKKGTLATLRKKDALLGDAVAAARAEEADTLRSALKKQVSLTDAFEKSGSAGSSGDDVDDIAVLRAELSAARTLAASRTAAEQTVRAGARAAHALVAELTAAMAQLGAASPVGAVSTLETLLQKYSAARSANELHDRDYEAHASAASPGGGEHRSAHARAGATATATAETAALTASLSAAETKLARAQGEAARVRDENAALRDKVAGLSSQLAGVANASRTGADAASRLASATADKAAIEKEVARLTAELAEARAATDAARVDGREDAATADAIAAVERERDAARMEASSSRDAAAAAEAAATDARARLAVAEADAATALADADRFRAEAAAADARASAAEAQRGDREGSAAMEAAARLTEAEANAAALAAAVEAAKAKAKADKDKIKAAAMRQFDELKAKALDEISAVKAASAQEMNALRADVEAARAELNESRSVGASSASRVRELGADVARARTVLKELRATMRTQSESTTRALVAMAADVSKKLAETGAGAADLLERLKKESAERRRLSNLVQELRGNIRVYARARPPLGPELSGEGGGVCISFPSDGEITVVNSKKAAKTWEFDHVFKPGTSNAQAFAEVEGLIGSTMDGFNVCIFAYGQTGSGKTFTMEGSAASPELRGINYRALDTLFAIGDARRADGWAYSISISMVEIYNEEIRDMLAERDANGLPLSTEKLKVREAGNGTFVPGLSSREVTGRDQVLDLMALGYKSRTTFSTNMNEHSSRSHALLTINVTGKNSITRMTMSGKLHLVDLAGCVARVAVSALLGRNLLHSPHPFCLQVRAPLSLRRYGRSS